MQRKRNNNEQSIKQMFRPQQYPDRYKITVRHKGVERILLELINDLVWKKDPNIEDIDTPEITFTKRQYLDDNGVLFKKGEVAGCEVGCIVRSDSTYSCHRCDNRTCRKHSIVIDEATGLAYCRIRIGCRVLGRLHWLAWNLHRIVRWCFTPCPGTGFGDRDDHVTVAEPYPTDDEIFSDEEMF